MTSVPAPKNYTPRKYHFDVKWLIILVIVAFLLLFQVFPLIYMLVKSLFPDGSFSLSTFERLYTYNMNWNALKNTVIAAFATMVFGTLLAFPLAWLVGRTNLYGKRFFRSLFVVLFSSLVLINSSARCFIATGKIFLCKNLIRFRTHFFQCVRISNACVEFKFCSIHHIFHTFRKWFAVCFSFSF